MKKTIALTAIAIICVFAACYILSSYHTVTYQRYYQITDKFTKITKDGIECWLHLKGHADTEITYDEYIRLNKGNYYLIEWTWVEPNIR